MPPPPAPHDDDMDGQRPNPNDIFGQPEVIPPGRARTIHVRRRGAFITRYFDT